MTIQDQINGINEYVNKYGTVKIDYRPTARKGDGGSPRYINITTVALMQYHSERENDKIYESGIVFGLSDDERVGFSFSPASIDKIHREMYSQPLDTPRWTPTAFFKMASPEEHTAYRKSHEQE
jgi:hypothetical protein